MENNNNNNNIPFIIRFYRFEHTPRRRPPYTLYNNNIIYLLAVVCDRARARVRVIIISLAYDRVILLTHTHTHSDFRVRFVSAPITIIITYHVFTPARGTDKISQPNGIQSSNLSVFRDIIEDGCKISVLILKFFFVSINTPGGHFTFERAVQNNEVFFIDFF